MPSTMRNPQRRRKLRGLSFSFADGFSGRCF
jgi:hypothetical protein